MNIHEYQGKALFKQHGVRVVEGVHCTSVSEALDAYDHLQSKVVAVKSQIHAGMWTDESACQFVPFLSPDFHRWFAIHASTPEDQLSGVPASIK